MVGATGIEPVTPAMSRQCSPAELRARELLPPLPASARLRKRPPNGPNAHMPRFQFPGPNVTSCLWNASAAGEKSPAGKRAFGASRMIDGRSCAPLDLFENKNDICIKQSGAKP